MATNGYRHGQWNATCDRCGIAYKSGQLKAEWTGLRTCSGADTMDCWEARNSQDFVRGVRDGQSPPWTRPEPEPIYTSVAGDVSEDDL